MVSLWPRSRAAWRRRHCSARASLRAAKLSARGTGTRKFRRIEADQSSDLALVVALARPAEPVLEQIVGLKLREDARSLPLPIAQDPGNRQLGVVVQDGHGGRRRRRQTPRCGHRRMLRSSPPDRPQQSNHHCGEGRRQGSGSSVTRRRSPPSLRRSPPGRDRGNGRVARTPHATEAPAHERSPSRWCSRIVKPYSSEAVEDALRSVPLLAVAVRSSSKIRSMIPVNGPSFGRLGGALRRYPATENDSILRTVLRSTPNTREASRVLIPSTCARRTRAYNSTRYIPPAFQSEQP